MKNIFWFFSTILFIFASNPLTSFSKSDPDTSKINDNQLNVEFLKNIPKNDYIIGPGDSLRILVSREIPELTQIVTVDGEGTIYLPRLKRIFVKDLTINELSALLNQAYKPFIKFPSVEVIVENYRPINVLVEGEVVNPGLYSLKGTYKEKFIDNSQLINDFDKQLTENIEQQITNIDSGNEKFNFFSNKNGLTHFFPTVFDSIRASGGITEYSDLSNIQIIRKNKISEGGGQITAILNFETLLNTGDNSQNIRIYDSDIIRIPKLKNPNKVLLREAILSNLNPRFINVYIAGRVNFPGYKTLSRVSVLSDAIMISGGTKVFKGPLTYISLKNDGNIEKRKFKYNQNAKRGSYKNPKLHNGDIIIVGNSLLSNTSEVISEITSPFSGIVSAYGLYKAILD